MLEQIIRAKRQEVQELKNSLTVDDIIPCQHPLDVENIFRSDFKNMAIIAEVKKASPVKGILANEQDVLKLAACYRENGATAISYITDSQFFQGQKERLPRVKEISSLPVLRKEFIIDEIQLYETVLLQADMVLLIAALHDYFKLLALSEKSRELGLQVLLEVHDQEELQKAKDLPVKMLGVNNRNLKDFSVDVHRSLDLAEHIPSSFIKVSESGIKNREDIQLLKEHGYNAVLVGEALVTAPDPGEKLRELLGHQNVN
ncbi:MAG: indole-3-glycerol phosphate synthase TrpC [Syntrophomonadaceae bacterium]|nr:indole-3-glycerol phosphate synthase TrpC [Syntrophomonadaceae bacterium]